MALMTDAQYDECVRRFIDENHTKQRDKATLTKPEIRAAFVELDKAYELTPPQLPDQTKSIAVNFNQVLPAPFNSKAGKEQKVSLNAVWSGVKYSTERGTLAVARA